MWKGNKILDMDSKCGNALERVETKNNGKETTKRKGEAEEQRKFRSVLEDDIYLVCDRRFDAK